MQVSAKELAELVAGRVEGDEDVMISAPAKIEEAKPGDITFLANLKYEEHLYTTKASAVLVGNDFKPKQDINCTLIYVEDVYQTLSFLLGQYGSGMDAQAGRSDKAEIAESASLADDVEVGPFTIISENVSIGKGTKIYGQVFLGPEVVIGENVTIYPGVKVYSRCQIGDRSIVHSNAVVGSDGFGFAKDDQGQFQKVPQIGNVILEHDVEVGANTVIDRATMGSTVIKAGAKLDNLIQIAHNVEVGNDTVIAAQTGIAGSTKIGNDVMLGGQVGIVGHVHIADKTMIQAGSGINKSVKEAGSKLYGYPAINYTQYLRAYAVFKELPDLRKRLELLEKKLKEHEHGD